MICNPSLHEPLRASKLLLVAGISLALAIAAVINGMLSLASLFFFCFLAALSLITWRLLQRLSATNTLLAAEKENLRLLSANLERKVLERSQELLVANEKLRQESDERREANLTLQQQIVFEQELLEAIPVPVFIKDVEGMYLSCNSIFAKLLGLPKEGIIGKTAFDLTSKELAEINQAQDESLFQQTGIQVSAGNVQNAQGEMLNVIFHKATFNHPDGSTGGLIGTILDITQQKQAENELRRYRKQLETIVDERTKGLERTQTALQYLLEDVNEAKKELELKVAEIERMNRIFVNRELRMVELKETIKALEQQKHDTGGN